MSGAQVHLQARGPFTEDPSYTLFSTQYEDRDVYVAETYEVPFMNPNPTFGSTASCTIPPKADLIRRITLRSELPQLYTPLGPGYVYSKYSDQVDGSIYVLGGTLAIQPGDFVGYFNTQFLNTWATNFVGYANISVMYNSTLNKFVFTSVYSNLYFQNENSASFWGFDIRSPDFFTSSGYFGYNFTGGTLTAPLTLAQSGWIRGYTPPPQSGFSYKDSVACRLVKEARLLIGGQTVDRLTAERLIIEDDLYVPYENKAGLTILEGKNDDNPVYTPREYYTRLTFNTDAIHISDLYRQDVRVEVDFEKFENLPSSLITTNGFLDGNAWVTSNIQALAGDSGQNFDPEWAIGWKNYIIIGPLLNNTYRLYNQDTKTFYNWTPNFRGVTHFTINGNTLYSSGYRAGTLSRANINTILSASNTPWTTSTYNFFSGWTGMPFGEGGNYIFEIVSDARYVYMFCLVNYYIIGTTYTNLLNGTLAGDMHTWTINYKFFNVTAPLSATNNTAMLSFLSKFASGYDTTTTASFFPTSTTITNPGTVSELTLSFAVVTGISVNNQVSSGLSGYITGPIRVIAISGTNVTIQFGPQNVPTIPSGTFVSFQNGPNISTQTTIGSDMQLTMTAYYTAVQQPYNQFIPGLAAHGNTMWIRYDSFGDFNSASSYSCTLTASGLPASTKDIFAPLYDFSGLPNTTFYFSVAFDGQNIMYPTDNFNGSASYVARIQTLNFTSVSAYSQVNTTTLSPRPFGNSDASVSDGRYFYFRSLSSIGSTTRFSRYDTYGSIYSQSSWSYYTGDSIIRASNYDDSYPCGFDGKYVYYYSPTIVQQPSNPTINYSRLALLHMYDTTKPFDDSNSWKWICIYSPGNTVASDGSHPVINFYAHRTDLTPSDPYYYSIGALKFITGGRYIYIVETDGRGFKMSYQDLIQFNPLTMSGSLATSMLVKYEKYTQKPQMPLSLYGQTYLNEFTLVSGRQFDFFTLRFINPVRELWVTVPAAVSRMVIRLNNEILVDDDQVTAQFIRPFEAHTAMPTSGNVYVFSMAINPEKLSDPSGTVNASRIATPTLEVYLTSPATADLNIKVHAKVYNVLETYSGLGGLLFNSDY
jgi:hypothetical protein